MFSLHEHVCHNFHMLLIKRFSIEILIMLLYVLNDTLCMKYEASACKKKVSEQLLDPLRIDFIFIISFII